MGSQQHPPGDRLPTHAHDRILSSGGTNQKVENDAMPATLVKLDPRKPNLRAQHASRTCVEACLGPQAIELEVVSSIVFFSHVDEGRFNCLLAGCAKLC